MSNSQNPSNQPAASSTVHSYKLGESLLEISVNYGVSLEELCQANNLTEQSMLFPGQKLVIPVRPRSAPISEKPTTHTVAPGENLVSISNTYGLRLEDLQEFNNLKTGAILFPGTVLKLTPPAKPIAVDSSKAPKHCLIHGYHKVKTGDQLARIAAFHGVSTQALLSANNLSWNSFVLPGTKLVVPIAHSALNCPALVKLSETSFSIATELVSVASNLGLSEFGIIAGLCLEMQRSGLVPELGNRQLIQSLLEDIHKVESIEELSVREALEKAGYSELAEGASLWEPSAWAWLHQIRSKGE